VQSNIEIDHVGDSGTFTSMSQIQAYAEHLYMVTYDDLRSVCKECHKIINHSQRHGVSFDDASILKEVIRICKEESLADIILFCGDYGYDDISNITKRKTAIEAILRSV
jgi:predicted SAM-dependent methyltransferase